MDFKSLSFRSLRRETEDTQLVRGYIELRFSDFPGLGFGALRFRALGFRGSDSEFGFRVEGVELRAWG